MNKTKLNSLFERFEKAIFSLLAYKTIKDSKLKMNRYVDLVVNANLNALSKFYLPLPKRILSQFATLIQVEYSELSENTQLSDISKANERMGVFARKYEVLRLCGIILTFDKTNKDVIDFLDRSNIKGKDILARVKSEMVMLEKKYKEVADYVATLKSKIPENKVSLSEYERVFQILNKNGYKADMKMSVLSFIEAMKLYKHEVDENNKTIERIKNKK